MAWPETAATPGRGHPEAAKELDAGKPTRALRQLHRLRDRVRSEILGTVRWLEREYGHDVAFWWICEMQGAVSDADTLLWRIL